jgi:predicted ATPase/class 3 adenylate cyclase
MASASRLAFGALLKRARRAARLTQAQLAERTGFSATYISKLECGARAPQRATVALLADALSLPPAERAALETALRLPPDRLLPTRQPAPFGDLLRRYRLAARLTQEELAERAGLSRRGIADLESGARRRPRRDTVALLSTALGVSETERVRFDAAARGSAERQIAAQSESQSDSSALPSGTVTFLFSDIEGSTRLLQGLGRGRFATLLAAHRELLRAALAAHSGHEVDSQGDSSFTVFPTAGQAVAAAVALQRALAAHAWPAGATVWVRMGLHSGTAQVAGDRYIGLDVHRAARIAAAGHGGQVLLSQTTCDLVEDDLPDGITLRDLGLHRLKDLQRPERLAQLVLPDLPGDFPPLNALDRHAHNLPIQPILLLGRERELAAVCALLRRDDVRLVTLTGPGGVGKTRLGLQVAAELADAFSDGVWSVRLSRLTNPDLVLPTIAQTLGLQEAGSRSIQELLRDFVRTRKLLLLLDNFEQVVAAAPSIADLLASSPGLRLLVTSRVALRLQGEQEYLVAPLALASTSARPPRARTAEQLLEAPAVALFLARARAHRPDFALTEASLSVVAAICARLDGLPLALDLAAAHVKVLPLPALLQRLDRRLPLLRGGARDLEARQQTMRATLAWSEDLLQPEDRRLFRRLAVFVGGFTLEAAEAVCAAPEGAEPLGCDVLEGLERLVDQSLVQQLTVGQDGAEKEQTEEGGGEARFRLLYVIREYALERLEASVEAAGGTGAGGTAGQAGHAGQEGSEAEALRCAHALYYLGLVEERELAIVQLEAAAWMGRLEREHDNFRAALAWARERGETELGLRLAGSLGPFWDVRGYRTEGRGWLEGLLALAPQLDRARAGHAGGAGAPGVSAAARAKALAWASTFAWQQQDNERAQEAATEALALARGQQGWVEGLALFMLGAVARDRGDLERATVYAEESVAQLRAVGEPGLAAAYLSIVGDIARDRGDLERATACYEEMLAFAGRTGADYAAGFALEGLAIVARWRGDLVGAESLAREQLLVQQRLGTTGYLASGLEELALTAAATAGGARAERAARLLGAAAALRERVGIPQDPRQPAEIERAAASARAALGEDTWEAAFAAGRALPLEEAIAEALGELR